MNLRRMSSRFINCALSVLIITIVCVACSRFAPAETRPPNVVILFVDDLGYADIGPFGAVKQKTPNLDRMAAEGKKLTSFYAAPVCSVSRAQLMTGCYGARVSVPGVFSPASKQGLHPNEITIAERLKERGYATMCIGKWHLGDQPQFLPTKQGFDRYFGIPYSNDMQRRSTEAKQNVVPLLRDDKVIELLTDEEQSRIVERYTQEAVGFIRENRDQPFLLYLPHTAVHTPIHPGEKFRGKSQNGRFGDWVEEVDWSVGQVLDTLRDLKLDTNTLVVFTSDNGPWLIKGADGGSALPLRGGKGSTWEGGVRVPTIAWWPGRIAAGTSSDAIAGTIDLLPTAVSIAGGEVPASPVIDGRNLSSLLFDKSSESPRGVHYYFAGYNLQAVRQGPWKLAVAEQPEPVGKDLEHDASIVPRLYNLNEEIGERTNLATKHPEKVAELTKLIEKMRAEIGGDEPSARRPPGIEDDPKTLYASEAANAAGGTASAGKKLPLNLAQSKIGDILSGRQAPQVANIAFQIQCQVQTTQIDGVIVAHGGTSVGYALHLKSGRLFFTMRESTTEQEVSIPFPASDSSREVRAGFTADGKLTLQSGSEQATSSKAVGFLPRQPKENFCIGTDDGQPITRYSSSASFSGKIEQLKIVPIK